MDFDPSRLRTEIGLADVDVSFREVLAKGSVDIVILATANVIPGADMTSETAFVKLCGYWGRAATSRRGCARTWPERSRCPRPRLDRRWPRGNVSKDGADLASRVSCGGSPVAMPGVAMPGLDFVRHCVGGPEVR